VTSLSRQLTALLLTTENKETNLTHAPETQKNEHRNLGIARTNIKLQNLGLVALYQEKDLRA